VHCCQSPLKKEYEWVGKYTCAVRRITTKFPKFYPPCPVFLVATWQQINKIKHLRKKSGNKLSFTWQQPSKIKHLHCHLVATSRITRLNLVDYANQVKTK